jgi:hypothetical protein
MKLLWTALIASWLIIAGLVYMFVIRGNVVDADDGRTAIVLSVGERNLVLSEMRGFLESVQEITQAVLDKDMKTAAESSARVGRVDLNDLPASLLRKLPVEVKKLGLATHLAFYNLAKDIRNGLAHDKIMPRLADIMTNCVGCHAGYRIDLESSK